MNTTKYLSALLAGAAVCALSTAPALAGAPDIHVSTLVGTPLVASSGMIHFKTVMAGHTARHAATYYTSTVDLSGTITSDFHGFVWPSPWSWGYQTSSGKCVQAPRKRVHQKYSKAMNGTVKAAVVQVENPCGTGTWNYYGPKYKITNKEAGEDAFKGHLSVRKFEGYNLRLNVNVSLKW